MPTFRTIVFASVIAAACACAGGREETPAFQDTHPLPDEPMVFPAPSIGRYGGRFVVAETSAPQTFNGAMATGASTTNITWQTYVGLTGFDSDTQEITPALAKTWDVSPDGLTWTFHLRKGAAFSDGHPMTAEDVVFSFDVYLDDTLRVQAHDHFVTNGGKWKVTAPDPLTVVIETPSPNALVPKLVNYSTFNVMPKHVLEPVYKSGGFASAYAVSAPPDSMVMSGPWRVQQYVAGEKTVLVRNPYWFGIDMERQRLPYLSELVHLIIPDQDAIDQKFRSGEIDGYMFSSVKPENHAWYEEHREDGTFTLHSPGPALSTNFFWFNLNKVRKATRGKRIGDPQVGAAKYAWFNNRGFRQAVSMAIDRDAMISSVFFGAAEKNWSQQTAADKVWSSPDIIKYDYNLAEAKKFLAALKFTDRNGDGWLEDTRGTMVSFTLMTDAANGAHVAMTSLIRDDLAKVGIRVTPAPVDSDTLISNVTSDFQYDAALIGLQSGVPPDPMWGQHIFRSGARNHFWNIEQPKPESPEEAKIDALMDEIQSVPDLAVRQAAWKEIENIVNYQCWFIWLPTVDVKLALQNRFGNAQPSALPLNLIWNIDRVYVKKP